MPTLAELLGHAPFFDAWPSHFGPSDTLPAPSFDPAWLQSQSPPLFPGVPLSPFDGSPLRSLTPQTKPSFDLPARGVLGDFNSQRDGASAPSAGILGFRPTEDLSHSPDGLWMSDTGAALSNPIARYSPLSNSSAAGFSQNPYPFGGTNAAPDLLSQVSFGQLPHAGFPGLAYHFASDALAARPPSRSPLTQSVDGAGAPPLSPPEFRTTASTAGISDNASDGGHATENDPRTISDAAPDDDWIPGAQYANRRRAGSSWVRIGGRLIETEGGQAARLERAQDQAEQAAARVRELDPNWRPTPSVYDSVEGRIRAYEADAREAELRARQLLRLGFQPNVRDGRPLPDWESSRDYVLGATFRDEPKTLGELQLAALVPMRGYDIHHIVEQSPAEQDGFARSQIDAPENLVSIPRVNHWSITRWFQTPNPDYGGLTPREYLRGKPWNERLEVGLDAMVKNGVLRR